MSILLKSPLAVGTRPPSAAISAYTMFPLERMLLVVFTVSSPTCLLASVAGITIQGKVGQNITLPCHYSTVENGIRTICWGRGRCPLTWCSSQIFRTNEQQSIYKKDSKYYLLGDVHQGHVSLTIVNVIEEDSGTYCCRVDISGLFNDVKHNIEVVVEKGNGSPTSARVPATIHFTETYFALGPRWMSNTQSPQDNISVPFTTLVREQRKEEPSRTVLYVGTGTCAVLFLIVAMLALKWYLHKKQKMSNSISANMPHILLQWIVIHICIVDTISQTVVKGVVGQAITLPCTYHVRNSYDLTDMCWGRGSCPNSKCSDEILRTNGRRVISRNSHRYQLRGSVTWGDVSLTITGLNERDKGLYCCRIEVPGWFNDIKKTLNLEVNRATTTVSTTTTTVSTTTIATTPQVIITTSTTSPLITTVTFPQASPFISNSPASPAAPTDAHIPTMTTSFVTTDITFLTTVSPLVSFKPSPTSRQDELTENVCCFFTTVTAPPATESPQRTVPFFSENQTLQSPQSAVVHPQMSENSTGDRNGSENRQHSDDHQKSSTEMTPANNSQNQFGNSDMLVTYKEVLILGAILLLILLLIPVALLVRSKKIGKYHIDETKSLNTHEEPEQTPAETGGENGMFPL
ncbi:T-cell immunoglobulin and mucin domain-containing protein 4-like [Zootoca vivipara]|uniref:T-cell immunoglobulin and mucin domain-containing protein 4-like n=1 Tax=Zootoca vivipara TaxID=8524 RepID=UPI00293BA5BA|nr:T-cell immunoglobulin and mucin domain-containing protein 4-like [Zootoca vivipara]